MKKIKNILCLVMTSILLFTVTGCGQGSNETQNVSNDSDTTSADSESESKDQNQENDLSLKEIKDKGKIILGTSADYAPYEFHILNDGKDEIVGFDIEIAKKVAENLGVELEILDMSFDGLITALNAGEVDMVMAGMTPDKKRKKAVDFSDIYYYAQQSVVVRKDDKDKYNTIDSLKGLNVAAQKTTIQENIVKEQMPESNCISLGKIPNIVLELKNKNVEAAIMETPVAQGYVSKYPNELVISDIAVVDETGGTAIAFKKGSSSLVSEVNKSIKDMQEKGLIEKFMVEANEKVQVDED